MGIFLTFLFGQGLDKLEEMKLQAQNHLNELSARNADSNEIENAQYELNEIEQAIAKRLAEINT